MFFYPLTPKGRAARKTAKAIYAACVQRARENVFYAQYGVPDTFDGRFEMIALHAGLVINRVGGEGKAGKMLAQAIFDEMFLNMEIACRQVGIGDLSVPKHIKRMMKALKGRALTYKTAIEEDKLYAALTNNLYATVGAPDLAILKVMSAYIRFCYHTLNDLPLADLEKGIIRFAVLPGEGNYAEAIKAA